MPGTDLKDDASRTDEDRLSRRNALKRMAVIGGAAWAAPVIQTLNMPHAAAQTAGGSPRTVCYCVKWDPSDSPSCDEGNFQCNVCTDDSVEGGCSPQRFTVTQNADGTWAVTLNAGCTFLEGHSVSKCGHTYCEPAIPNASDTGATFVPCHTDRHDKDISNIQFVYCCEETD